MSAFTGVKSGGLLVSVNDVRAPDSLSAVEVLRQCANLLMDVDFYQRAALRARWSGGAICSPGEKFPIVVDRGHKDMIKKVIEVTEFNCVVR